MPRSPLSPRHALVRLVLVSLFAASCSTAGTELARAGQREDGLPFGDDADTDQPLAGPEVPDSQPAEELDPSVAGPAFPETASGPTLSIAGDDGVWWLDPAGSAHLVVEPAVAADYDGAGGLVFQRSFTSPIVRRTAESAEIELVTAGEGETVRLIGVESTDGQHRVVHLRTTPEENTATLEVTTLDGGQTTAIGPVTRDGVTPERWSITDGYLSALYRGGDGSGWVTWSLESGQKRFGTANGELGRCGTEPEPECAEAVTVTADASTVYQVAPTDEDGLALIVNRASDFAEVTRIDLQRPGNGWHATGIEVLGDAVVVNRSVAPDGTGSLPALVVEPGSGEITQLPYVGQAVAIAS